MKRETAFKGFYKNLKQFEELQTIAKEQGGTWGFQEEYKMANLRTLKYAKSLVNEHNYQDVHTDKYIKVTRH